MIAVWVCAGVSAASAYVSLGFSIVAVRVSPRDASAARYALARSIALAAVATVAFFTGAPAFLVAVALAMILVQGGDAVIGVTLRDRMKTFGPAALAVVDLAALIWVLTTAAWPTD